MKNKFLVLSILALVSVSCKTPLNVANVHTEKNTYITEDLPEDQNFKTVIAPYKAELEGKMNSKISHTAVELNKKGDNSNLGNLLADFTYEGAKDWAKKNTNYSVDCAVINIGGIRSSIGAGNIITQQVYEVMPFENEVVIIKMKGADLYGIFDYYAAKQKNNPVSHLYIETDGGKLIKGLIDGKTLDNNKIYHIATSDYLAFGGDYMNFFSKGEIINTGIKLRDLFIEKFKQNPEILANSEARLIFKNKKADNE